jgi:hypothetical protein
LEELKLGTSSAQVDSHGISDSGMPAMVNMVLLRKLSLSNIDTIEESNKIFAEGASYLSGLVRLE